MPELSLHLSALPAAQRRLWREFSALPPSFVLYGGTAAALHLGHRHSVDFDFFANRALDLPALEAGIPFLAGAGVVQREPNTLSVIVDRGGPVKVSFFGVPKLPRLEPPSFPRSRSRPCRTSGTAICGRCLKMSRQGWSPQHERSTWSGCRR
ncbi:MAG TPA: nucleotidyl transferase AbiEii/AbiGii toxin family protein [Steroidobacteraceae bacterium]|nr:nucleotidyl transferase AbiEii/AbiGii toxin family protein [Steroidobacteraceae bacterium]